MNSFACFCPGVLFQYEALGLASQAEILDSHFLLVTPQYGSGPTRLIEANDVCIDHVNRKGMLTVVGLRKEQWRPLTMPFHPLALHHRPCTTR